jgi:hypothetical protein
MGSSGYIVRGCERSEQTAGLSSVEMVLRGFALVIDRRAGPTATKLSSRSVKERTKSQTCPPCSTGSKPQSKRVRPNGVKEIHGSRQKVAGIFLVPRPQTRFSMGRVKWLASALSTSIRLPCLSGQ